MLLSIRAVESQPTRVSLSKEQVECLRSIGEALASKNSWWGGEAQQDRSVISISMLALHDYELIFRNVIGSVRVADLQIQVAPKIAESHFNYLISRSELAPRFAKDEISLNLDFGFFEVIARWCVNAADRLLRVGLRKDYRLQQQHVSEIRGTMLPVETALAVYRGIPLAACEFEELENDAPLNRVVKAACELISTSMNCSPSIRRDARSAVNRMNDIGKLQLSDLKVRVDRLTSSYSKVVPLSLIVLNGLGISTGRGGIRGEAFLVRTPELIEDGIRNCLREEMKSISVKKRDLFSGIQVFL